MNITKIIAIGLGAVLALMALLYFVVLPTYIDQTLDDDWEIPDQDPEQNPENPTNSAEMTEPMGADFADELTTTGLSPLRVTYEHTRPGEYSEIFVTLIGLNPGEDVEVILINPDNTENTRTVTADENGTISETFRIYQFGDYHVRAIPAVSGTQFNAGVIVK